MVGRGGRKAWPKGVADRRGRKAWPEGVAGRRALGFKPIRSNLAVPWCAKSQKVKMLHSPRCPLDALKKFQIPVDLSAFESSQPLVKLLEAHRICCVWSFRRSRTTRITEVFTNSVLPKGHSGTPVTVI